MIIEEVSSLLIENSLKSNEPSSSTSILLKNPVNDILTESEFQVKIADLGNACWTVSFIFYVL